MHTTEAKIGALTLVVTELLAQFSPEGRKRMLDAAFAKADPSEAAFITSLQNATPKG